YTLADQLDGAAGDDYIYASAGNDTIDGGADIDTLDMSAAGTDGSYVDLATGHAFSTATGLDRISNIENVKGSAGDDGLFGNDEDNVFIASGGFDVIAGRNGSDTYDAGAATGGMSVNLDSDAGSISGAHRAQITSIENVITGSGDDAVSGSGDDNIINTGA